MLPAMVKMIEDVDGVLVPDPPKKTATKTTKSRATRSHDRYVVETGPLAVVVRGFIDDWNRSRPPVNNQYDGISRKTTTRVSPIEWLVQETGLGPTVIEHIQRATNPNGLAARPFTKLRDADALLSAIGRPDLLRDGTLTVRSRAEATQSRRATFTRIPRT